MIPLMRPQPPRLSEAAALLRQIEDSGVFSNFGPVNTRFEAEATARLFAGTGACLTVCNATLGLMLAMRAVTEGGDPRRRYALMPSFTFAAAAQAALWSGFTPLLCDIDPRDWAADAGAEEELLRRHAGEVAVVVPYATFGHDIDLARYERLSARHGVPVVVDAAASLGTQSARGGGFGTGFGGPVVFSMHATKSFATGEGGLVYSADADLVARLRAMCNFGFGAPRSATMPGLNAKLSEVGALLALLRLQEYDTAIDARGALMARYRDRLPELTFQAPSGLRQAHQFVPALLPPGTAPLRAELQAAMQAGGIGLGHYFSPHLAEQPHFAANCRAGSLSVTQDVAGRMVSLPLYDGMQPEDVDAVAARLRSTLRRLGAGRRARAAAPRGAAAPAAAAALAMLRPAGGADVQPAPAAR